MTPRLACILLWYPLFTQPFIFRELEGLQEHLDLSVFTLYGANTAHCSEAMLAANNKARHFGVRALPKLLLRLLLWTAAHPIRMAKTLAKHLFRPWPSLEIFGENLWAFCMAFLLTDWINPKHFDLIYAPWPRGCAQAAQVLSELTGLPYCVTVRGDNLMPADPDLEDKMRGALFIRTNNAADVARIESFGAGSARGKTYLVYNSLTLNSQTLSVPGERTQHILSYDGKRPLALMALGRFDATKGFDDLLLACAILKKQGLAFTLTLAGGGGIAFGLGGMSGKLSAMTRDLKLTDCVSYPGLISHDDLPAILKAHDIFIAPCVIDAQGRRDGIPNTLIEAMSLGLPVIATNIHALPEIVCDRKTGLLVPPNSPENLALAISDLAKNPALAADMGKNAAAFVSQLFSPKNNARIFADCMKEALGKKKSSGDGPCVA
ncbi:MAG: glycosyltransferase family 4 protein [Desulfovibrionaceae bacterium]|nr:glycosyltransferase family 4 protein [Desulfovibrionaceae bacterium]